MPSLRRSLSTASSRPSPYRGAYSTAHNRGVRARGHGHRRSSGSETSGRRVLADIEWWRVMDGQREIAIPESEHRERDENTPPPLSPAQPPVANLGLDLSDSEPALPASPSTWTAASPSSPEMLPAQFSALSITPSTPTRRRHSRESSASSLDSLPEFPLFSTESLNFGLADFDLPFEDAGSPLPSRRLRPNPFTFDLFSSLINAREDVDGTPMDGLDFSFN